MRKNRLLLDQKRFLSFSNYRNIIKYSLNGNDNTKKIINSKIPSLNLKLLNDIKMSQKRKANNVSNFRNNSIRIFENNIRLLAKENNKSNLNLSGNFEKEYKQNQRNYNCSFKNILNIDKEYFGNINELLKQNYFRFHLNKRVTKSLDIKNNYNRNRINPANNINERTFYRCSDFNCFKDNEGNDKPKTLIKTNSENITTRKFSKELFKRNNNGIIVKRKGKKKVKYKIIGTLTTETNYKTIKKT